MLKAAIGLLALAEILAGIGVLVGAAVLAVDPSWGMATLFVVLLLPLSLLIGTGISLLFRCPVSYYIHLLAFLILTLGSVCLFGSVVGLKNFVNGLLVAGATVIPIEVWFISPSVRKLFRVTS
jgi:hypothetical protein